MIITNTKNVEEQIKTLSSGTIATLLNPYIGDNSSRYKIIDKIREMWLNNNMIKIGLWQDSWNKFIKDNDFMDFVSKHRKIKPFLVKGYYENEFAFIGGVKHVKTYEETADRTETIEKFIPFDKARKNGMFELQEFIKGYSTIKEFRDYIYTHYCSINNENEYIEIELKWIKIMLTKNNKLYYAIRAY